MSIFVRTSSIAVSWNAERCLALRLRANHDKCEVVDFWEKSYGKESSLAETIAEAVKALGGDDSIYIIAGGDNFGWGSAYVTLPALAGHELKNALAFELRKQTPIPVEKLRWGFRLLPSAAGKAAGQRVLLVYVKAEQWSKWTAALSGLSHVDVLLPAPAVLDPLLSDSAVLLPDCQQQLFYEYQPSPEGRLLVPVTFDESYGLAHFLPEQHFNFSSLSVLPISRQRDFVPTLLLGAYGLTRELGRDRQTLISLPDNLRPRRNIASKVISFALLFYIFACFAVVLARQLQAKSAHLRRLDLEIQAVQAQLVQLQKQNHPGEADFATILKQEMRDNIQQVPDFPAALLELTRLISPPAWASGRLEWNAGQISLQLQDPQNDLELSRKLEFSPILGDVRELGSSFNPRENFYIRRLVLNARYDTEDEKVQRELQQAVQDAATEKAEPETVDEEKEEDEEPETATENEPDKEVAAEEEEAGIEE